MSIFASLLDYDQKTKQLLEAGKWGKLIDIQMNNVDQYFAEFVSKIQWGN